MKKNDKIELEIVGMTLQGDGIARLGGVPVFVPATCPGDMIRAHILKVKANCAFGKCAELLSPGPQRIDPQCEAFPRCGGCAFRHIGYAAELNIKQHETGEILRRIGGINLELEPICGVDQPERYRNKAMLPVHIDAQGVARAGYYARHSHRVVHSSDCRLQPEIFKRMADIVCEWAQETACSIYDEAAHKGLLRHIYLRQSQNGAQALACLVINGSTIPQADRLIARLRLVCPNLRGVLLNHNTDRTNVVLGAKNTILWGEEYITERLCGLEFTLSPQSFFQVNPAQAERLYHIAAEYAGLQGHERVLDLYCGTGTIGLTMAHSCAELIGVESVSQAVEDARRNAARNGIANAQFLCMDARQAATRLANDGWQPDVVLIDPPRKGCEASLLQIIADMAPDRIVYISCDPATLARDLAILKTLGYQAQRIKPVDMFPRTGHVESVVLMSRG